MVCGDSHTATHGAFGAFALGIGTSEVEHVLATQCLRQSRPLTMEVRIEGDLPIGVTAKDAALGVLNAIGTAGAAGHVVEYTGSVVRGFSMEQRMTLCNLTIEGGGRAGMIAPDATTFAYIKRRPYAPTGATWDEAVAAWSELQSDDGAVYDRVVHIDAATLEPTVTWGTTPAQSVAVTGRVPDPDSFEDAAERESAVRALAYMGLEPGTAIEDIKLDTVFIGSCTNGRIEDLRAAAAVLAGRRVHDGMRVLVVPGSAQVKVQAESEGLDAIFTERRRRMAQSRSCSMCLGMNPDILQPGERCESTSNRNFEGRQGRGGRTHLVSPAMAAAAAVEGQFVDVRRVAVPAGARMKPFHREDRSAHPARSIRCRHRSDHPQAIPQAHREDRLRRVPVQRLASRPVGSRAARFRPQPGGVCAGHRDGCGTKLRVRLLAGARGMGAGRPRHPRDHRRVLRGHLQGQRAGQRTAPGDPCPSTRCAP